MKVALKSSGGLAGRGISGVLDTADLPDELARRVEEHLTSRNLRSAAASRSGPIPRSLPVPDAQEYHLSLLPEDEDGAIETHVVDDMSAAGEVLDVIDDLMAELVRRKQEAAAEPPE